MGAKDERRRGRPLADQRSLGKETGREGKGRMKKKRTNFLAPWDQSEPE